MKRAMSWTAAQRRARRLFGERGMAYQDAAGLKHVGRHRPEGGGFVTLGAGRSFEAAFAEAAMLGAGRAAS